MALSLPSCLFILAGVFGTSILSGILGMAGGMVLMGLLVWVLPVQQAMMLHAISQFFANASRAFIHRDRIHRQGLKYYFAGLILMFGIFSLISFVPSKLTVFLILGITPYLAFLLPKDLELDFTKPKQAFIAGLSVTGVQLIAGVSGPLLGIFFQSNSMTRYETVATKAFTQTASHITKFIYFGFVVSGFATATAGLPLWLCLAVIPTALGGSHVSKYVLDRLTDKHFYRATQATLFIIGAIYLEKAFMLFLDLHRHAG